MFSDLVAHRVARVGGRRRFERACRAVPRSVMLDDALTALAAVDARKSQVVETRFFGGLSVEETAEALHV